MEENKKQIEAALGKPVFSNKKVWWKAIRKMSAKRTPKVSVDTSVYAPVIDAIEYENVPVKVRAELHKWLRQGINPKVILEGKNPFDTLAHSSFGKVVVDIYLQHGQINAIEFVDRIGKEQIAKSGRANTVATNRSWLSVTAGALSACGIFIVDKGSKK